MGTRKLTQSAVSALSRKQKTYIEWDSEISGLGVCVSPGGTKTFIYRYRDRRGRKVRDRKKKIGRYGSLTVTDARKIAARWATSLAAGNSLDQGDEKDAPASATMESFCVQYLKEYAIPQKKAKTVKDEQERINRTILPTFGSRQLHTISKKDVQTLHSSMHQTPYEANRVLALLRIIFKYAETTQYIKTAENPCTGIKPYRERRRERFLSQAELARIFRICTRHVSENMGSTYAVLALQTLMLTGARRDEIRTLKWNQIDLENGKISLIDTKTGNRIIPISDALDRLLRSVPKQANNPYVFCGQKKGTCVVNLRKPWQLILAKSGLDNVRIHDLRHSYASLCISSGKDLETTRKLLGHRDSRTTMQYVHVGDQRLQETSNAIGKLFDTPADTP